MDQWDGPWKETESLASITRTREEMTRISNSVPPTLLHSTTQIAECGEEKSSQFTTHNEKKIRIQQKNGQPVHLLSRSSRSLALMMSNSQEESGKLVFPPLESFFRQVGSAATH